MKTEKMINKIICGWLVRTPLLLVIGLFSIVLPKLYAEFPVEAWEIMCRGKGNDQAYDIEEIADLGFIAVGYSAAIKLVKLQ